MKIALSGVVHNGKVEWDDIPETLKTFEQFEASHVLITVEPFRRKRSYLQNNYYWGVVIDIAWRTFRDLGNGDLSPSDVHEALKLKFLKGFVLIENVETLDFAKSSTSLSTVEFMSYVERIQQYFAEQFQIIIPSPNEELIA